MHNQADVETHADRPEVGVFRLIELVELQRRMRRIQLEIEGRGLDCLLLVAVELRRLVKEKFRHGAIITRATAENLKNSGGISPMRGRPGGTRPHRSTKCGRISASLPLENLRVAGRAFAGAYRRRVERLDHRLVLRQAVRALNDQVVCGDHGQFVVAGDHGIE